MTSIVSDYLASTDNADLFIPRAYDLVVSAHILLAIVAFANILLHAHKLTIGQLVAWGAFIVVVPVLGPLFWLFAGRKSALKAASDAGKSDGDGDATQA